MCLYSTYTIGPSPWRRPPGTRRVQVTAVMAYLLRTRVPHWRKCEWWQAKNAKELGLFSAFLFDFSLVVAFASFPRNMTISELLHFCFSFHSHVFWVSKIIWRNLKILNLEKNNVIISGIIWNVYFQRQIAFLTFSLRQSVGHTTKYLHCSHL